jgi:hypothetical protein
MIGAEKRAGAATLKLENEPIMKCEAPECKSQNKKPEQCPAPAS